MMTIFALATPPGRGAVAVVRVSGPAASEILDQLTDRRPEPRRAALRFLRNESGAVLDQALVLWFPGPGSFTGEDSLELHLHGGLAVVESISDRLLSLGLRPAEPGEFTRRAYQNGRLDLTQAEAVADLVDAETESQRAQALEQLGGALSRRYDRWRDDLIEALAMLEAAIDFPDEELPEDVAARARPPLRGLLADLDAALEDERRGERVRDGFRIALIGEPNAGKSTLFNALVGREAAIVTPTPGTTRDVIEAYLVLGGRRVILADTAGLRETDDVVEAEGVSRARAWAESADLRLLLVPTDQPAEVPQDQSRTWLLRTMGDLGGPERGDVISARTGEGVDALRTRLEQAVIAATSGADFPAVTQARHRARLIEARSHLQRALLADEAELAAEDVRLCLRALEAVTGRVSVDDVLDQVFGRFCIGK